MELTINRNDRTAKVVVEGCLTTARCGDELLELVTGLTALGVESIVLDLERLDWLDAAGVGQLVRAWVAARKGGAVLRLRRLRPVQRDMLEAVGLLLVFQVVDDQAPRHLVDDRSLARPPQSYRRSSGGRAQPLRTSRTMTFI